MQLSDDSHNQKEKNYMLTGPDIKEVERIINASLQEDVGTGDITAQLLIPEAVTAELVFVNREAMVMCGGFIVPMVFAAVNPSINAFVQCREGEKIPPGTRLIEVRGQGRAILTAERVALNLLQRMSSVATLTAEYVKAVRHTHAGILDTRKTMPGLRVLDKYAVRTGGGINHRMRLDDAILIKDNHIAVCGSLRAAFERACSGNTGNLLIEIECDTLAQAEEAITLGATRIMLDNMTLEQMRAAVALNRGRAQLEASGNVNIANVCQIAETGVDFISIGRLTHSVPGIDIGLDRVFDL